MHFLVFSVWLWIFAGPVICLKTVGKPMIQDLFASSRLTENATAFLSCQVGGGVGEERMQFRWFFENQETKIKKEIDPSDGNISINNLDAVSILNIRSMTTDTSGAFTCEVSNSLGSDSRTVNLKLNSKFIVG